MNVVVQPAAGAAFLLSDTACVGPDGTLLDLRPKVTTVLLNGRAAAAISSTGMGGQFYWRPHLKALKACTAVEFQAALPAIFRAVEAELIGRGVPEACGISHMSAVVAIYDHDVGGVRGYAISNDDSLFNASRPGARAYEPYTLQPVRKYLTRFAGRPFPPGTDLTDPTQWCAQEDAAALIEAQRADLFGPVGAQYTAIGGHATLTRVSAMGVDHTIVARWPDRIGRPIDTAPRAPLWRDILVAGMNVLRARPLPSISLICKQP